ncbi:hypothetical protein JCM33774_69490 [Actinophytocola sp. KF-1]
MPERGLLLADAEDRAGEPSARFELRLGQLGRLGVDPRSDHDPSSIACITQLVVRYKHAPRLAPQANELAVTPIP